MVVVPQGRGRLAVGVDVVAVPAGRDGVGGMPVVFGRDEPAVQVDDGVAAQPVPLPDDDPAAGAGPDGGAGEHAVIAQDPGLAARQDLDRGLPDRHLIEVRRLRPMHGNGRLGYVQRPGERFGPGHGRVGVPLRDQVRDRRSGGGHRARLEDSTSAQHCRPFRSVTGQHHRGAQLAGGLGGTAGADALARGIEQRCATTSGSASQKASRRSRKTRQAFSTHIPEFIGAGFPTYRRLMRAGAEISRVYAAMRVAWTRFTRGSPGDEKDLTSPIPPRRRTGRCGSQ